MWIAIASLAGCGGGTLGDGPDPGVADASPEPPDAEPAACPGGGEPSLVHADTDGDGFGDPAAPMQVCEPTAGFVDDASDCDDTDRDVNPDARELCGDDIDNDCANGDACAAARVARWRFDEPGGDVAVEEVGGFDGALIGGPTWLVEDGALDFDGVDDYVEVAHDDAFALDAGTVAVLFRVQDAVTRQGLWSKDSSGFDTGGHLSLWVQDGVVQARIQSTEASFTAVSEEITVGDWHQATLHFGPGGLALYVDGVIQGTNPYEGGLGPSSGGEGNFEPLAIGTLTINSDDLVATPISHPNAGDIGDVQVFNRALAPGEIAELFQLTR